PNGRVPSLILRNSPPALKSYPDRGSFDLPPGESPGEVQRMLLERRTWRRFGGDPLPLSDLATLLRLTWGVQGWVDLKGTKPVALKTSPSGGARHSLEVYLLAFNVGGLPVGTYHYQPDTHRLVDLEIPTAPACLEEQLPTQPWFHRPAAVFFMTSIFDRVQWKYGHPRSYRLVLLEAGHFSQTFLLVATALGLAPFCTAALGDSAIENHLRINGLDESVVFANGVGTRPPDPGSAGAPDGEEPLKISMPAHGMPALQEATRGQEKE
ncbi:MAG: SagB/ThcOx family dehydrogenase, partial [Acidobacteriota bacterium]